MRDRAQVVAGLFLVANAFFSVTQLHKKALPVAEEDVHNIMASLNQDIIIPVPDKMMTPPNNNNNDNNRSNNYTVTIASSEKIIFGDPEYEKLTKAFPKPQAAEIQRIPSMPKVPSYGGAAGGISFEQQQQQGNAAFPTSSSSTNDNACSCWSTAAIAASCCKRSVYRWHKMGSFLTVDLLAPINFNRPRPVKVSRGLSLPQMERRIVERYSEMRKTQQGRDVVVIRNYVEAIISGYLYHKSGRECWTDPRGIVRRESDYHYSMKNVDWEKFVSPSSSPQHSRPPGRGRNLCAYLAEESETDGLQVYAEFAMNKFYPGLQNFVDTVKRKGYDHDTDGNDSQQQQQRRGVGAAVVLFLCYEDLSNPLTQGRETKRMIDWLFPGGGHDEHYRQHLLPRPREPPPEYSGNHATSHDPDLRRRLRQIVERLDSERYNHTIAKFDNTTRCGTVVA